MLRICEKKLKEAEGKIALTAAETEKDKPKTAVPEQGPPPEEAPPESEAETLF